MTTKQDYALFLSMVDAVHVRLDIAGRFRVYMWYRHFREHAPTTRATRLFEQAVRAVRMMNNIDPVRVCAVHLANVVDALAVHNNVQYMQDSVLSAIADDAARRMMKDANMPEAVAIRKAIAMHVCLYGKKKAAA